MSEVAAIVAGTGMHSAELDDGISGDELRRIAHRRLAGRKGTLLDLLLAIDLDAAYSTDVSVADLRRKHIPWSKHQLGHHQSHKEREHRWNRKSPRLHTIGHIVAILRHNCAAHPCFELVDGRRTYCWRADESTVACFAPARMIGLVVPLTDSVEQMELTWSFVGP